MSSDPKPIRAEMIPVEVPPEVPCELYCAAEFRIFNHQAPHRWMGELFRQESDARSRVELALSRGFKAVLFKLTDPTPPTEKAATSEEYEKAIQKTRRTIEDDLRAYVSNSDAVQLSSRIMASVSALLANRESEGREGEKPFRWFSYDGQSFETHDTEAAAMKSAEEAFESCREEAPDGWPDEVEQICWGVVTQEVEETLRRTRRDDDPCSRICDEFVDYALMPALKSPAKTAASDETKKASKGIGALAEGVTVTVPLKRLVDVENRAERAEAEVARLNVEVADDPSVESDFDAAIEKIEKMYEIWRYERHRSRVLRDSATKLRTEITRLNSQNAELTRGIEALIAELAKARGGK